MYTINELEFIGESLPKINDNFTELDGDISTVNAKVTSLISLSSAFYTNNASNFTTQNYDLSLLGGTYVTKSSIYSNLSSTNLIYPISIYLNLKYSSVPSDSDNIIFYCTPTEGASEIELCRGSYLVANLTQLFTFQDLGFYDWKIVYPASSTAGTLNIVYRYAT